MQVALTLPPAFEFPNLLNSSNGQNFYRALGLTLLQYFRSLHSNYDRCESDFVCVHRRVQGWTFSCSCIWFRWIQFFLHLFGNLGSMFGHSHSAENIPSRAAKDPPIYRDLPISLEDLLNGTTKKMKITRNVTDGGMTFEEEKILTVNIKKGWKAGTKITFAEEGDQKPGTTPADIIFVIKDKPHELFERDSDNNLLYTCKLSLKEALTGSTVQIPTLEGTTESLNLSSVTQPGATRRINDKGLPLPKTPDRHGDLLVTFQVHIPEHLSPQQKESLGRMLP